MLGTVIAQNTVNTTSKNTDLVSSAFYRGKDNKNIEINKSMNNMSMVLSSDVKETKGRVSEG